MQHLQDSGIFDSVGDIFLATTLFLFCLGIVALIGFVVVTVSQWRIYSKAGQPGWACIIPIYNVLVLLDIIRKPRLWLLYILVAAIIQGIYSSMTMDASDANTVPLTLTILNVVASLVSLVLGIRMSHGISTAFGKQVGFTIGLILLPIVFFPILAFGSATYQYQSTSLSSLSS
jgi:hypothetical protein